MKNGKANDFTRRDFIARALIAGSSVAFGGTASADEYLPDTSKLPPGSVGDPMNPWFGKHIFPLEHTMVDGPSAFVENGKVIQPRREIPIFHKTDVVVVGGGPAGFAAAIAASQAGAHVALVERYGSLGGLFTNGMVLIVLATSENIGDGKFRFVTKGVCGDLIERLHAIGPHAITSCTKPDGNYLPTVDAEAAKYVMDRMVEEAKINMFFHAWGVDVIQDGRDVKGVVFESKEGRQAILAKEVIDATGDGDLFFAAGENYRQITHSIGFVVQLGNMDRIGNTAQVPQNAKTVGPWPMRSNEPNRALWWGNSLGPQGNGVSVRDLTAAEIQHRKQWFEHVEEMRNTPGWEKVYLANTASQIGPRASRLLDAVTILDRSVLFNRKTFADSIGMFGQDGPHSAHQVPFGAILPKKVDHLLVAGRSLGAPDTTDTFRLIAPCFVTGQAAGVAAALAAKTGVRPRDLDVASVQSELKRQRVVIA